MKFAFKKLLIASTLTASGCGSGNPSVSNTNGPGVSVMYQSDPLADVQVRLHADSTGPVIAQAISSVDGIARFAETPSPEPSEYFVSLASQGDGGWILDSKYLKPADSGMKLKPLTDNDGQRIELPRGAVRPLEPNNRR